jgi:hypothetical protein
VRDEAELERLAWHEAAHATAAYLLGGCIRGPVSIEPRLHWAGVAFCRSRRVPFSDIDRSASGPMCLLPPRLRRAIETDIIISLAGPAAERIRPGRPIESGYVAAHERDPDEERSRLLVAALTTTEVRLLEHGDDENRPIKSDMTNAWNGCDALAQELSGLQLQMLQVETDLLVRTPRFQTLCAALAEALLENITLSARSVRAILRAHDPIEAAAAVSR